MEEKPTLTKDQIEDLHKQYSELCSTLKEYRSVMVSRGYKKNFTADQRKTGKKQYEFFRTCMNQTLVTLIDQKALKPIVAVSALGNRFVKWTVKWQISKYLRHEC